ncbi:type II/IV secretion system protein E [Nesterenkonia sp. AN1]|uniref:TadA family conjugal transfer-associated ATPase n=1 Tax=Nesterenkonia sp. AN1 TaxID=652017 RepID=UPI00044BAD97|nr:TadA family conjugal transfer-associated ATPase [Nesterenkonia sp. AN1]EXF23961.1 type II/IV secretion system protein E [Nesterenkonia sp. AN1]
MSDQQLHALRETLTSSAEPVTAARIAEAVRASGLALGSRTTGELVRTLRDELVGLGPLQPLVEQPGVTDVLIDGHRQVWTDGPEGLAQTAVRFATEEQVRGLARRLIALSGGRLDEGQPCADGRIGDCRVHAVIPPVAVEGTMISVRISRGSAVTLEQLALQWDAPEVWLPVIRGVVDARLNCLISGATGSGKTSLLGAMLAACPHQERIIIVEDTTELRPDHPHVLHLQQRRGNVEGAGELGMGQLVRETLRMRPDRLIVGECRGGELKDFLTAMNTGHQGAVGTVHANSPHAVPARLIAMGALADLPPESVALQAGAALDAVIHMERRRGRRMPVAISMVRCMGRALQMVPALLAEDLDSGDPPGVQTQVGWDELTRRIGLR